MCLPTIHLICVMVDFKKLARLSVSKAALMDDKIGCHEQGHVV